QNIIKFEGFDVSSAIYSSTTTLAVIFYTLDSMVIGDGIYHFDISLVPNEFAIETNPMTFDETLRRCQFYWEKSTATDLLLANATTANCLTSRMVGQNN